MKHIQGASITGYVTILVKGNLPELFFQACINRGIPVWDIEKVAEDKCKGNVSLGHIKVIRKLKRETDYKLTFIEKKGYPFLLKKFIKKKEIVLSVITSFLLVLFLSNIVWEIKIVGVPKDIEEKITEELNDYGIHLGTWTYSLDTSSSIQQRLLKDIPDLLWVGIHKKGTTIFIEGVEKEVVKEKEVHGPRNLIATKNGIIQKMYVSKGLPIVKVNDYVERGDLLVSGKINAGEDTEDKETESELVAAEGEITANTWYEIAVTVPLKGSYEELTGNKESKHYLRLGKIQMPFWGLGKPEYAEIHRETNEKSLYFFKWKLPIKYIESILSEKKYNRIDRTKEEAINAGILQAKQELKLQLGPNAEILSEKILHDTTENGKVNLSVHISVVEDIVKVEPINQGD